MVEKGEMENDLSLSRQNKKKQHEAATTKPQRHQEQQQQLKCKMHCILACIAIGTIEKKEYE